MSRIPPHDLDSEAAVLSSAMLDSAALDVAVEILSPHHFYSEPNRRIFEGAIELSKAGKTVDVVTIAGWLRDRDRLKQVGGIEYLNQIIDTTPAVSRVDIYAKLVREKWRVRSVISTCQRIAAEGYGDVGEVQKWIDGAEQSVYEIARAPESTSLRKMGEYAKVLFEKIVEAARRGERITGIPTGFRDLDRMTTGLHDGELTIVAGRPGMGKTSLAEKWARNIATHDGETQYGAAFFSLEMPGEQIAMRAISSDAMVDMNHIRTGEISARDWEKLTPATSGIYNLPIWLDEASTLNVLELRAKIRRLQAEYDRPARDGKKAQRVGAAFVDYLQLLHSVEHTNSREQDISSISRGLKRIAMELRIPVVAMSQLNRGVEAQSKDKRPTMAQLRESGAIEQDADNVILVYRDEYYFPDTTEDKGIAELNLAKQRNGPTGVVKVRFDAAYTRFDNLDPNHDARSPEAESARAGEYARPSYYDGEER